MKRPSTRKLNKALLNTALAAGLTLFSAAALAATIINPGQCVVVGGTEVCASMPTREQCEQTKRQTATDVIFSCRYDSHPTAETKNLKTYAVVRSHVTTYGQKVDMVVKDYGITDKDACEKDAETRNTP